MNNVDDITEISSKEHQENLDPVDQDIQDSEEQAEPALTEDVQTIQDVLETWNNRFPDDSRLLDVQDLVLLVNQETYTDQEFVLIQTMLAYLLDAQQFAAGNVLLTEVASAFLKRNANRASKKTKSETARKRLTEDANLGAQVLSQLAFDVHRFGVDALAVLGDLNNKVTTASDLVSELTNLDTRIETETRRRNADLEKDLEDQ